MAKAGGRGPTPAKMKMVALLRGRFYFKQAGVGLEPSKTILWLHVHPLPWYNGARRRMFMNKDTYIVSLKNNVEILKAFLSHMSPEDIMHRVKDYWTVYQHVEHLAESQRVLLDRMNLFLSEERPVIRPYGPSGKIAAASLPIHSHVEEFEKLRNQQVALIQNAGEEVWNKSGEHPEFKIYSFDILVRHALLHDGFHMWRMEELWIKKENLILELNSN
jgi:hypothetical protein